jgi:hypothetical protein
MSKYTGKDTPEFYNEMIDLGMRGLSLEECGDYHDLGPLEWAEWCEKHPLTVARHKTGKARGVALAGKELLSQIEAGKINAITFYLKTQGQFTEKQAIPADLPKPTESPSLAGLDPTEAAKRYKDWITGS